MIRRGTGRRTGKAKAYDQREDAMRFRLPALEKVLIFTIVKDNKYRNAGQKEAVQLIFDIEQTLDLSIQLIRCTQRAQRRHLLQLQLMLAELRTNAFSFSFRSERMPVDHR